MKKNKNGCTPLSPEIISKLPEVKAKFSPIRNPKKWQYVPEFNEQLQINPDDDEGSEILEEGCKVRTGVKCFTGKFYL